MFCCVVLVGGWSHLQPPTALTTTLQRHVLAMLLFTCTLICICWSTALTLGLGAAEAQHGHHLLLGVAVATLNVQHAGVVLGGGGGAAQAWRALVRVVDRQRACSGSVGGAYLVQQQPRAVDAYTVQQLEHFIEKANVKHRPCQLSVWCGGGVSVLPGERPRATPKATVALVFPDAPHTFTSMCPKCPGQSLTCALPV